MWWIVLLAVVLGVSNGFFAGLFVQGAIVSKTEMKRPYGRMIDLHRGEWRRL